MSKKHSVVFASTSVLVGLVGFGCGNSSEQNVSSGQPSATFTPSSVPADGHDHGPSTLLKCPNGAAPYMTVNDYFAPVDTPEQAPASDRVMTEAQDLLRESNYPFIDQPGPLEFSEGDRGKAQVIARAATGEVIVKFELSVIRGEWRIETVQACAAPMEKEVK